MKSLVIAVLLGTTSPALAQEVCSLSISKTMRPVQGAINHQNLCIDNYFSGLRLGQLSLDFDSKTGEEVTSNNSRLMVYDDSMLVKSHTPSPLGEQGRLNALEVIYNSYQKNIRNENGLCRLEILDGERALNFSDLKVVARSIEGLIGTRVTLGKNDIPNAKWRLSCPNQQGKMEITKSGSYFFIFVDIYDPAPGMNVQGNLSKFLFSFRQTTEEVRASGRQ